MLLFKKVLPILLLALLAGFLRFYNLGYSEFQDDEKKAFIRKDATTTTYEFLMDQKKGPMQFLVTSTTLLLHNDPRNEFVIRFPFTIANLLSVMALYLILKELFESTIVAFLGALVFSINGFMVGFSRIAQYQNLNLLFSLSALYFFIMLNKNKRLQLLYSLLGTTMFSLSLLSHWDAIFFLLPIIYLYVKFLLNKEVDKKDKIKITALNFLLGCLLILPFLIPYIKTQLFHEANIDYFNRRVGLSDYTWEKHKFIFELYNPFVAIYFLPLLACLSIFNGKRNIKFLVWFLINFIFIRYFMEKPGTHVYNYVIPSIFIVTSGMQFLYKHKGVFIAVAIPLLVVIGFLYYQSYIVFVENSREYPWDENEILKLDSINFVTNQYEKKEILTFGFPHFRNWKEVNKIVSNDPDNCTYISNEGKEITQIYMDNKYGILSNRNCYYIVDVKRPFITRGNGAVFSKTKGKEPLYEYERNGEKLLKIHKIITN